jgi:hypothetical protein
MGEMIPGQFFGLVTIGLFAVFIALQRVLPALRRLNRHEIIGFVGALLLLALVGGVFTLR